MKYRESLEKHLEEVFKKNYNNLEWRQKMVDVLNFKYSIPRGLTSDIITLRISLKDQAELVLYALTAHCEAEIKNKYYVEKHFTEQEQNSFPNLQYKVQKIKFPIKWDMVQIADDQWIGKIDVKELMKLRDAQLIKYNENAQRTLKRVVSNGNEYYTIALNRTAVEQIMESYSTDSYISNVITLNLPEYADYYYDDERKQLVIKETDCFDILDGYHRYIAMSNLTLKNKSFDYPMELRVVVFPEEKARQFIWQEDQKTKMSKVDSESFNQTNLGNQVVQKLNTMGELTGIINRNKGIIDAATMASAINIMWFRNVGKKESKKVAIDVRKDLYHKLEYLIEDDSNLLVKRWSRPFIICTLFVCLQGVDLKLMRETIDNLVEKTKNTDMYKGREFTVRYLNQLKKVYEEG